MWKGIIRQYPDFYRFEDDRHVVTLQEGNTPLIPAPSGGIDSGVFRSEWRFMAHQGRCPTRFNWSKFYPQQIEFSTNFLFRAERFLLSAESR